jgi:hypothetical protein
MYFDTSKPQPTLLQTVTMPSPTPIEKDSKREMPQKKSSWLDMPFNQYTPSKEPVKTQTSTETTIQPESAVVLPSSGYPIKEKQPQTIEELRASEKLGTGDRQSFNLDTMRYLRDRVQKNPKELARFQQIEQMSRKTPETLRLMESLGKI